VKLVERAADGLNIPIEIVDACEDPARAAKFEVRSTPAIFLMRGAHVVRFKSGRITARELERWLGETNGGA
jgi:hypothetical protein